MSSMREMINLMESSISEGKMSDIIIDAQQMSKEEFDAHYKGAWNYDEILADYPVEEANNPDAGEYTYTLDYSGESQGYPHHELTITSPEGESKVVADKFTYFEVEGDELQAELHSWFNMGHGVGDEGLGEADESFDPMSEPTQYDSAMDVYQDNGEDALAEYLGMSSQEFDQELNEYCIEHGLHADDDRDMAIHGMVEQMIDNEHQMADMREPEEMDEERVDEIIPVVGAALWSGARIAAPFLARTGWSMLKGAGVVVRTAPKTSLAAGGALYYKEELKAVTDWATKTGADVTEIVKASKQYALPLLAVVAVLYGGKKIHDMITNKDPETQDELATENTKDEQLPPCHLCKGKGCNDCDNTGEDDGHAYGTKGDTTNEEEELNNLRKRAGLEVRAVSERAECHSKDHDCATKVIHPTWGEGKPMYESHAVPTDEGYVAWYDVEFEHGIEKEVPAQDMEIITLAEHGSTLKASKFKPHMMYNPKTGEGKMAKVEQDHLDMKAKGWGHEKPELEENQDLEYGGHKTLSDIPYEEETEQTDGTISFSQSKSSDKGSVTIEASAENMEELHKVLALAGLEIPSTDVPVEEPSLDVVDVIDTDDEEPQVGDCGDTLSHDDVAYSTDKEVLKNYLQTQLKNRLS
jgi:hypothetical protein